jgi:hypothetical protein
MEFWSIFVLILKNFKYVVQLVQMLDQNIKKGMSEKDIQVGMERLEKGFSHATTIKETAASAGHINDSFRK